MSRGTPALVGWLAIVTLLMIVLFSAFLLITGWSDDGRRHGFWRLVWTNLMHSLDPGTVAGDGGSARYLVTMLVLTIGGLFIVSALIGVIATGIDARIAELQRGRSLVIETDHSVILGWSDAVFTIVSELAVANESRKRAVIAILADRDKVEMEEELREKAPDLRGTRIVCRTGSPMDIADLSMINHARARSVVVLSPGGEDADSEVIKTLLALTHDAGGQAHVVAEIAEPSNLDVARMVGGSRTVVVDRQELIARLIVQTSRQSGASAVYSELFAFDGDEIYFHTDGRLVGKTYAEVVHAYEKVAVIGVLIDGDVVLNPPASTVLGADHELLVIAEDDSNLDELTLRSAAVDEQRVVAAPPEPQQPTRTLILGWNTRANSVLEELDEYAAPNSQVHILTAYGEPQLPTMTNYHARVERGSTTDRATLAGLDIAAYDHVMVLCYSDHLPADKADARALVTLLHVRDLLSGVEGAPALVSEMLDDRNRELANVAQVDDVIVSDRILSLMLAQLSEEGRLHDVFGELLRSEGSEIYLRPVESYVSPGSEVTFDTVVHAAMLRGETAVGYRIATNAHDGDRAYGVRVNPGKSERFTPAVGDTVVVLAEN